MTTRTPYLLTALLAGCLDASPGARANDGGEPGIDAAPDPKEDGGLPDAGANCDAILVDGFDELDAVVWNDNTSGEASVTVSESVLQIATTAQPSYGDLVTNAGHTLAGLRATATVTAADGDASIGLIQPGDPVENGFNLFTLDGYLNAVRRDQEVGTTLACDRCAEYSPGDHPLWRLRVTATHVHYEVGDGDSWSLLGSSEILRPGAYHLIFTAYTPVDVPASITVDDVVLEGCQN